MINRYWALRAFQVADTWHLEVWEMHQITESEASVERREQVEMERPGPLFVVERPAGANKKARKGRWTISNNVFNKRPSFIPEIKELPPSPRTRGWQTHSPAAVTLDYKFTTPFDPWRVLPRNNMPWLQLTILLRPRPPSFIGVQTTCHATLWECSYFSEPDHRKLLRSCSMCFITKCIDQKLAC